MTAPLTLTQVKLPWKRELPGLIAVVRNISETALPMLRLHGVATLATGEQRPFQSQFSVGEIEPGRREELWIDVQDAAALSFERISDAQAGERPFAAKAARRAQFNLGPLNLELGPRRWIIEVGA